MTYSRTRSRKIGPDGYGYRQLRRLGMSDVAALSILPQIKINSFVSGSIIWPKGDLIDSWSLVVTGLIAQFSPSESRQSMPVHIYGTGSWFGEESIVNKIPSSLGYECLTDIDAITLPKAVILRLLEQDLGFSENFSRVTVARLQRKAEVLALQKNGKPCMKVVLGIAQIVDALIAEHELGKELSQLTIPITQGVLASLCGVARTVFSSYVLQLEQIGWIEISYGKLGIVQLKQWQSLLNRYRTSRLSPTFDSVAELISLIGSDRL
ncbi:Crp/Fnr family transcriptional regulator [Herbaspirillum autotrophicum]|uniref:Crp/Fnr family transcriptional regulator n=1 Tax=Herbaspirillum autotrophicum TaxID=180195 RepID=UPI00067E0293|nr:Crp/Fnr family transcriptional regulator [Herbaspirillum autotrophicum]